MKLHLPLVLALVACNGEPTDPFAACAEVGPMETWRDNDVPDVIADAFEDAFDAQGVRGVTYAILVDGEIRYAGAHGEADPAADRPMEPDTLLRSGSTVKMQTAALVMALEGEGVLSRDDTLAEHLPEFDMQLAPGVAPAATVHQLLTHQGGFYDHTPVDTPAGPRGLYNQVHGEFATTVPMLTEPGNFYNYSNPNFALAGLVAEEAAGEPYHDLMTTLVWEPLCMLRTTMEPEPVLADGNYAVARSAFDASGEQRIEPGTYDSGFSRPAGFAWTSAMDMLRFADFLLEGDDTVMPSAQSEAITAFQVDTLDVPGGNNGYGYGIEIRERYQFRDTFAGPLLSHGGAIPGYAADLYIHQPSGVAVAILASTDGASFALPALIAIEELGSPASAAPIDYGTDTMDLSDYEGTFRDPDNVGDITFTVVDDQLILDAPRFDELSVPYEPVMEPLAADNFLFDAQGSPISSTFVRDETGSVRWLRTRLFVAERVDN
jgi:CubicO group peptidase (beta-lactamase class C family)